MSSLMQHYIVETFIFFLGKEWRDNKVNRNMNTCEDLAEKGHSKSFQIVHCKTFSFSLDYLYFVFQWIQCVWLFHQSGVLKAGLWNKKKPFR